MHIRTSMLAILVILLSGLVSRGVPDVDKRPVPALNRLEPTVPIQSIEGGWYLIQGSYQGESRGGNGPFQFKLFGEKHFAFLMDSGTGQWDYASSGTYKIVGDRYIETFEFSTNPAYVGVIAEWLFDLRGDTLIMEGPTKIINKEGREDPDLAGGYHSMREVRIRAK